MMTAPASYRIETLRLSLRPFTAEHITSRYVGWLNDPEVVRYSENRHRTHSLETCRAYFEEMRRGSHYFWAIHAKAEPAGHVGNLTAYRDSINGRAELAILIGERSAWGKGYGAEAWRGAMDFLFAEGIRKVTAGTMATNVGMLKIMEKTGMTIEATLRDHFLLDEDLVDCVLVAKFREARF